MLKAIQKVGSGIKGAVLNAKERHDANINNAAIMTALMKQDRDFFSPDKEMIDRVQLAMIEAMEKEIVKLRDQTAMFDKKGKPLAQKSEKAAANKIAMAGLFAGMEVVKEVISTRIDNQETVGGGSPAELSPSYEAWKQKKVGFITIGKLTGQLLDNLAPGRRNIKPFR